MKKTIFIYGLVPKSSTNLVYHTNNTVKLNSTEKQRLKNIDFPVPSQPVMKKILLRSITVDSRVVTDKTWMNSIERQGVSMMVQK